MGQGVSMIEEQPFYMDFESLDEVLTALDQDPMPGASDASHENSATDRWDLGIGWDGALDAYTGGWSEGAQKAYDLAESLVPRPIASRSHLVSNVAGGVPNVGAYLAGAPNAMYQISKKSAKGKPYVHLYMPIGYAGSMDANTAFDRGCALVALADALETAGCRVKITLTRNSLVGSRDQVRLVMRFMVKDYGDRLDIDQLIFTAAHPAMFRRLCFGLQERCKDGVVWRATNNGYGRPTGLVPSEDCEQDPRAVVVCFPRLEPRYSSFTPERFLAQMVAVLPDDIQTEIQTNGKVGQ